jgi:hypothetical protein
LIQTFYDYPNFRVMLRCNLNNDQGQFFGFYGQKGTLILKESTLTYMPQNTRVEPESYSINGWPARLRDEYLATWQKEHPSPAPLDFQTEEESETFGVEPGYSDLVDHEANFFNAVRSRQRTVEDEKFGNNAAIGCHLANYSYFKETAAVWDAAANRIRG